MYCSISFCAVHISHRCQVSFSALTMLAGDRRPTKYLHHPQSFLMKQVEEECHDS